jgi:hypothetical protein
MMSKSVHQLKRVADPCAVVTYGTGFETFNYGGGQRTSAANAATDAEPGGLVV